MSHGLQKCPWLGPIPPVQAIWCFISIQMGMWKQSWKQIDQSGGFLRLRVTTGESLIGWSK